MRPALCEDALRLGRILAELAPGRAGGSRPRGADGDPGLTLRGAAQLDGRADAAARSGPRALGSPARIVAASRRSSAPSGCGGPLGPYALQAAIAACHARALHGGRNRLGSASRRCTTRSRSSRRRRSSSSIAPSRWRWPSDRQRGSSSSTRSPASERLRTTTCSPSVRGDLLARLGRFKEAHAELERAASLTHNARERRLLLERAAACAWASPPA